MLVISNLSKKSSGKVLIAKFKNQDENNILVTILQNTTGITPIITKESTGNYILSGFENLNQDKIICLVQGGGGIISHVTIGGGPDLNKIRISNFDFILGVFQSSDISFSDVNLIIEILD